jgi:selenocysteine-specific elongation factor
MPRTDAAVVDFLLADLVREKIVAVEGDALDIPGRSKKLGGAEGELARLIESKFVDGGLQPPPVSELIKAIPQKPKVIEGVIGFLVKRGTLVRLADGLYVHHTTIEAAKQRMATRKGTTIDVGQFKDFFGLSRKVAIPLLEFFDAAGVTKRVGDQRLVL